MELDKYLEKKAGGIEYMEKAFDNTLQMIHLFKNDMYNDIKYKIRELRNAAIIPLKLLERTNCFKPHLKLKPKSKLSNTA